MGSTDYRNASPMMRDILVKHVNTDLTEDVKKISVPTFIIWGDNDLAVDVADAYELEELLQDAGLVVYEGCTHYAYLERLNQTVNVLKTFFSIVQNNISLILTAVNTNAKQACNQLKTTVSSAETWGIIDKDGKEGIKQKPEACTKIETNCNKENVRSCAQQLNVKVINVIIFFILSFLIFI